MIRRSLCAALALAASTVLAGPIQPVLDVNRTVGVPTDGTPAVALGGRWLFTACTPAKCLPASSDGTPGGTQILVTTTFNNSTPTAFAATSTTGYFDNADSFQAPRLFRTDGTLSGTSVIPGAIPAAPLKGRLTALGNAMLFAGRDGLWKTDGTAQGTVQLVASVNVNQLVQVGNVAFFEGVDAAHGSALWKTDGTVQGTVLVRDITTDAGTRITALAAVNGKAFFFTQRNASAPPTLWVSDGTDAGTQELAAGIAIGNTGSNIVELGGKAYVLARSGPSQSLNLVQSDGSPAGTTVVQTWSGGPDGNTALYVAGAKLYFVAPDGTRLQMWSSDGTPAAAVQVSSFTDAHFPYQVVSTGTAIFFSTQGLLGEAYRIDPATNAMTSYGMNFIVAGTMGTRAILLANFLASSSTAYLTDTPGTMTALTTAPGDINNASRCAASGSTVLGNRVVFAADDGLHGCEFWVSDGTSGGTQLLADSVAGPTSGVLQYGALNFANAGNVVYFLAGDPTALDLWKTDGTPGGTQRVVPSTAARNATAMLGGAGGFAYFLATANGVSSIYRTDGTVAGTVALRTLGAHEALAAAPRNAAVFFGGLFVATIDNFGGGTNIYRLDGNGASVVFHGVYSYSGVEIVASATRLYFLLQTSPPGPTYFYASDGTSAYPLQLGNGVGSVAPMHALGIQGDTLYFTRPANLNAPGTQVSVWRTDGTDAGTNMIPGAWEEAVGSLAGNYFYLAGRDSPSLNYRLVRTNGGAVADVLPVQRPAVPGMEAIVGSGEAAWMVLNDYGGYGRELWSTYGPRTTTLVQDYAVGGWDSISAAAPVTTMNLLPTGILYFAGTGDRGEEPVFMAFDTYPDALVFPSQVDVPPNTAIISAPVHVTGITVPVQVVASPSPPGMFCVSSMNNCACDVAGYQSSGVVGNGVYICAETFSAAGPSTTTATNLNIGGYLTQFAVTTAPLRHLAVTLAGTGAGHVESVGRVISCGTQCGGDFQQGSTVSLNAVRTPGSIFTGWSGACTGLGTCNVVMGGDRTVTANFATSAGARPGQVDLDGDGRADLVWTNANAGAQGAWTMNGMQPIETGALVRTNFTIAFIADFDGDGRSDILWHAPWGQYDLWTMASVNADGRATIYNGDTSWQVVAVADLNGDGKADLIWRHTSGVYGAWLMNGNNPIATGAIPQPSPDAVLARTGDFDGDGKADILWMRPDGTYDITLMDGLAAKAPATTVLAGGYGWFVDNAGDFNGDGRTDLVWKHNDGSYGIWLLDGTTVMSAKVVLGPATGWTLSAVGDLDGDGKSDLLWTGPGGAVGGWLMNGVDLAAPPALLIDAGSGWSIVNVRDFDGDGKDDITWRHSSGAYGLWLMNGLTAKSTAAILGGGSGWELVK